MKKTRKDKSERFWDRTASSYDKSESKDFKQNQQILASIHKYTNATDQVLDFACGTGTYSVQMAKIVKQVHAIDISSKMLDRAKQKAEKHKVQNINFLQTTIFHDNLKSESYDIVFAFYILHLLEDPQKVLAKIYSLLKPGGLFISVCPCMGETKTLGSLMSFVSKLGFVPTVKSFKTKELEELIEEQHFQIVESKKLVGSFSQQYLVCKK